jgi:hypothetical protein
MGSLNLNLSASAEDFKNAWLKAGKPVKPPFKNAIHTTDIAYALCLYRDGPFQIELYICKPNTETPFHSHPGIESVSLYLTGNLNFGRKDIGFVDLSQYQKPKENGTHMLLGKSVESGFAAEHAVKIGPEGGAFLIFEKWHTKAPTSVTINWEGNLVGEEHARTIEVANS